MPPGLFTLREQQRLHYTAGREERTAGLKSRRSFVIREPSDHKSPLTMTDRDRDFIREVDEAVRQDRYKKLWDEYGIYALAAARRPRGWRCRLQGLDLLAGAEVGRGRRQIHASARPWKRGPTRRRPRSSSLRWSRMGLRATAPSRASSSPRPRRRTAIPTRRSPTTMRSPTTRASTTFCAAMPRSRPRRSGSTRPTMPRWRSG